MTYPPDDKVMAAIQEGHFELLGVLFERYHHKALGLCLTMVHDRSLADDLVQEAFIRVLRYRKSFKDGSSFGAWLYRIVRNVCLDQLHSRKREQAAIERADWTDGDDATGNPWSESEDLRIPVLRSALGKLPPEQREALVLKRVHGLSYKEIAERCNSSEGAVRVRAHRALKELRALVRTIEIEGETV